MKDPYLYTNSEVLKNQADYLVEQERKTRPLTGRDQRKDHSLGKREIKERTGK